MAVARTTGTELPKVEMRARTRRCTMSTPSYQKYSPR